MAYDATKDQYPVGFSPRSVITPPTRCYAVTAAAAELPLYAKALAIYVPDGITASITLVYLNDADGSAVTRKFGAGNHYLIGRIRRVTAISGAGVEVHAETD